MGTVYSSDKQYTRIGECTHCGVCCSGCSQLIWKAVRSIGAGEIIVSGKDFTSECLAYDPESPDHRIYVETGCLTFPPHPVSTPKECGYRWVEAAEK